MPQLNSIPNFNVPLSKDGITVKDWFFFWNGLYVGLAAALPYSVTVTASPFTFKAAVKGTLFVSGGTISAITFSRDGTTTFPTGVTAGPLPINANDIYTITYTVKPTVSFVST